MDIRQLETFLCVAQHKSFTKAAELLYITQPTVSNQISNLEKEFDTILFVRSRRHVALTKSGLILVNYAQNILKTHRAMTNELRSFSDTMEGHINLYASSVPRKYLLPKLINEFSEEYPLIKYSLINDDSTSVINSLLSGETDFGFVGMKVDSNKLHYSEIMEDELVYITSECLHTSDKNPYSISVKDILGKKLILREDGSGTRALFQSALRNSKYSINEEDIIAYVEDPATILKMVSSGIGGAVVSRYEALESVGEGKLNAYYLDDVVLRRNFYFVYNADMQYTPVNRIFRSFVLSKLKKK